MFEHIVIDGYIAFAAVGSLVFWTLAYQGYRRDTRPATRTGAVVPDRRHEEPAFRKAA
jgi:hypothetical protein